jgi:hypothetical protein
MLKPLTLLCVALITTGAAPHTANLYRDAITPVTGLAADKVTSLSGESDNEIVTADITLSGKDGAISKIVLIKDGKVLRLADAAFASISGATVAWLEERGALTTVVIEGETADRDWRLALEFHPKQLWLRRLSREGIAQDSFTYYDRDDLSKTRSFARRSGNHGFHPALRR